MGLSFKFLILQITTRLFGKYIPVQRSNVGLAKAETIGVLYSYTGPAKHRVVQRFIRDLKNLNKSVSVLCYITDKDRMSPSRNLLYAFGHEALTVYGQVTNDRVNTFIRTSFDYLFHVDVDTNIVLDYIVAHNQAKCRVGHFDVQRKHLFEVMVKVYRTDSTEDIERLTSQMLHYTGCMES